MNESVTVRSEGRGIYTPSRNLTVQIYVGSSDVDLGTSDINRKNCSHRVRSPEICVETSDIDPNGWISTLSIIALSSLLTVTHSFIATYSRPKQLSSIHDSSLSPLPFAPIFDPPRVLSERRVD